MPDQTPSPDSRWARAHPWVTAVALLATVATLTKLSLLSRGAGGPQYRQAATGTFSFDDKGDADYGGNAPPTTIYRYLDGQAARALKEPRTGWRVSRLGQLR